MQYEVQEISSVHISSPMLSIILCNVLGIKSASPEMNKKVFLWTNSAQVDVSDICVSYMCEELDLEPGRKTSLSDTNNRRMAVLIEKTKTLF